MKANQEFRQAANPSAILSLLDHIGQQEAEILKLHSSLAGAVQHGEQGWQRYEAANKMCLNQQNEIAALNEEIASLRKDALRYRQLTKRACFVGTAIHCELEFESIVCEHDFSNDSFGARFEASCDKAMDGLLIGVCTDTSTQEVG